MADVSLEKIEKRIKKLAKRQRAIRKCLDSMAAEGASGEAGGAPTKVEVCQFLDGFRAGEALGERTTGAWAEVSTTACVRGALRVVQQREGFHARLLESRLVELGGEARFAVPADQVEAAMKQSASTEKSDAQKLLDFVGRFGDIDAVLAPICEFADRLDADPETQGLLRAIVQDERSTLELLSDACRQLNA